MTSLQERNPSEDQKNRRLDEIANELALWAAKGSLSEEDKARVEALEREQEELRTK